MAPELAVQGAQRGLGGSIASRINEVSNGLGLAKIQAPVEEGAAGELAGLRLTRPECL